jgi:hypothetical protein
MKFTLMMILLLGSSLAFAKDVNGFSKALNEDVKKDIETDNVQALQKDNSPMRKPASVEPVDTEIKEDSKIGNQFRQIGGGKNW